MIEQIKNSPQLNQYIVTKLEDGGIRVDIAKDVPNDKIIAIKVDDYYQGLHQKRIPKSIDFLVVVDCECQNYVMYLLELKNVKSGSHLSLGDIKEKFENTIEDFLKIRFKEIFDVDNIKYKNILLFLVSNAYYKSEESVSYDKIKRIRSRINSKDSLKVDINLGNKLFKFHGKILEIKFEVPPYPIIKRQL